MPSVLQDWTTEISLRCQGVLVIALRGPDGVRKEDAAKPLVRSLRGLIMNAGRTGKPMERGVLWEEDPFMTVYWLEDVERWAEVTKYFFDQWDSYNIHFLQHLAHAYAVIGIHHPDNDFAEKAWTFYERCCRKLHMYPETQTQVLYRLRDGKREEEGQHD